MINANELRIGNLVNFRNRKTTGRSLYPYQIVFTDFKSVIFKDGEFVFKEERLEPIPLTPDILEKAGFENRSNSTDFAFKYGEFIIGGTMSRLFPSIHGESRLEAYGNEIFYLHQLQNLYFALTGEELTINL